MAALLSYHRREARPVWWAFFNRIESDHAELIDDIEALGGLQPDPAAPPETCSSHGSTLAGLIVPPQESKLREGSVHDPATPDLPAIGIRKMDLESGELTLWRGPKYAEATLPSALIPGGPIRTDAHQAALKRLARTVIDAHSDGPFRACRDLLARVEPRVVERKPGSPLYADATDVDELRSIVRRLDSSALIIQGPPGSGKTYTGARLITELIRGKRRIGVAAPSHRAIINLLEEVDRAAAEEGLEYSGLKKRGDDDDTAYESENFASTNDNGALTNPEVDLAAGTSWHFARDDNDETLDYLFIDEAGQVSLADALAMGTAAHNIVLLGDPQQLPQVIQGRHPERAERSALEHVLGERQTVPPAKGVFLDRTWRLHPKLAEFCSELMYDGRLQSVDVRDRQELLSLAEPELNGSGLRWLPVAHEGNTQSSAEEAERIAGLFGQLLGGRYRDFNEDEHPLELEDILVITPFNAQVRCLTERLSEGARIGTVDKFQGQEAQVVIFSLASSAGSAVPRGLGFLLNRNRMNVALSRARCVAIVVASPALLDVECRSVEEMRLVNAVCRVEEVG